MVAIQKYHGTGNDFIVVDADEDVPNRRTFATALCDRTDGIEHPDGETRGADGVLFLALEATYRPPRVVMTLVQPDGSVAAMCGNGARCAAQWVADRTGASEVMIDTPSGTRHASIEGGPDTGTYVTIEMGEPSFDPVRVPLARDEPLIEEEVAGLTVTAVDTGVPHAVAFVEDVDGVDLESVAPAVRHADVFSKGANVTLASAVGTEEGYGGFRQRTFERGVEGETRSCGTGAVAVAAIARELGYVADGERVTVSPPGGDLDVTVDGRNAFLHGPVVHEFDATVAAPLARPIDTADD
jgi:diaminopimelate epimerase